MSDSDEAKVFVSDDGGSNQYVGFFEDDGETGYLYVSDRNDKRIVEHLQIYANSLDLNIGEHEVEVIWSKDHTRCGVRIFGGLRGVIDMRHARQARAFMTRRDTPPITAAEWMVGFD